MMKYELSCIAHPRLIHFAGAFGQESSASIMVRIYQYLTTYLVAKLGYDFVA